MTPGRTLRPEPVPSGQGRQPRCLLTSLTEPLPGGLPYPIDFLLTALARCLPLLGDSLQTLLGTLELRPRDRALQDRRPSHTAATRDSRGPDLACSSPRCVVPGSHVCFSL